MCQTADERQGEAQRIARHSEHEIVRRQSVGAPPDELEASLIEYAMAARDEFAAQARTGVAEPYSHLGIDDDIRGVVGDPVARREQLEPYIGANLRSNAMFALPWERSQDDLAVDADVIADLFLDTRRFADASPDRKLAEVPMIGPRSLVPAPHFGQRLRIRGQLDLRHQRVGVPVAFEDCTFDQEPLLSRAVLPELTFIRCIIPGLIADGVRVEHDLSLRDSQATAQVMLRYAQIGGSLDCVGVRLTNASGTALDCEGARIAGDVFLRPEAPQGDGKLQRCEITGEVKLFGAQIGGSLACAGARLMNDRGPALNADLAHITGGVFLSAWSPPDDTRQQLCEITGGVYLVSAQIGGSLDCVGARLTSGKDAALNANLAHINGGVFLNACSMQDDGLPERCEITGGVYLIGAQIRGSLNCAGARLTNDGCPAITANGAHIAGDMLLCIWLPPDDGEPKRCEITGGVHLIGAHIEGSLSCAGARLTNGGGPALVASGLHVAGGMFLSAWAGHDRTEAQRCEITGGVILVAARIAGSLDCAGVRLTSGSEPALNANRAHITGGMFLTVVHPQNGGDAQRCEITGEVRLLGVHIDGALDCAGAQLTSDGGPVLNATRSRITEYMSLSAWAPQDGREHQRCEITGEIRLNGAQISGPLVIASAVLDGSRGDALNASDAEIMGGLFLGTFERAEAATPCTIVGALRLSDARIGRRLQLRDVTIRGEVILTGCRTPELVGDLRDTGDGGWSDAWPEDFRIHLEGFAYERFGSETTWSSTARFTWLRRTPEYSPAPWEQLQRVYASHGHDERARRTAIEKQRDRLARGHLPRRSRIWRHVLGAVIGHGYRPERAGAWAMMAMVLLTVLFWVGRSEVSYVGRPEPASAAKPVTTGAETLSLPEAAAYAADTFIPVADFKIADNWRASGWIEAVRVLAVATGWLLGTIFIAGFTRLVRT